MIKLDYNIIYTDYKSTITVTESSASTTTKRCAKAPNK